MQIILKLKKLHKLLISSVKSHLIWRKWGQIWPIGREILDWSDGLGRLCLGKCASKASQLFTRNFPNSSIQILKAKSYRSHYARRHWYRHFHKQSAFLPLFSLLWTNEIIKFYQRHVLIQFRICPVCVRQSCQSVRDSDQLDCLRLKGTFFFLIFANTLPFDLYLSVLFASFEELGNKHRGVFFMQSHLHSSNVTLEVFPLHYTKEKK